MATKTVRILTGGNNNHQETAYSFNALATDFFSPGIVGAVSLNSGSGGSGGFAVNAESSPTMQVRVSLGSLYAAVTPSGGLSQNVRVDMNAFEDFTITSQGAGAHYAWLYMNIDPALSANPDANAQTVASLVVSYSTSVSVDNGTPALYGYLLAVINISSSPVSIVNANITDSRVQAGTNAAGQGSIAPAMLATGAITLGYAQITTNFTSTVAAAYTDVTSLSVTVTVPSGGRRVKVTIGGYYMSTTAAAGTFVEAIIYDTTASTVIGGTGASTAGASYGVNPFCVASPTPSAGSRTYKVQFKSANAGTFTLACSPTVPAFILVEAI